MYSQRDEEQYITSFFAGKKGVFLDIGAFHPTDKSNTRRIFELGWSGAFIEPSRNLWGAFDDEYSEHFKSGRLEIHKIALHQVDGVKEFTDSGGDAVSSFDPDMVRRWSSRPGDQYDDPEKYDVPIMTVKTFLTKTSFSRFDFINIDTEGMGMEILIQIPFDQLQTKMVCIEFDDKLIQISEYLKSKGFSKLHQTAENLIFVR